MRHLFLLVAAALPVMLAAGCTPTQYALNRPPDSVVLQWQKPAVSFLPTGSNPPDSIVIRWRPSESSEDDAKYVAERNCLAWDRNAQEVRAWTSADMRSAKFVCQPLREALSE